MTPTEAKRINRDIIDAVHGIVGDDGWDVLESWDWCGEDPPSEQYVELGKRRLPLPGTPDEIAERVRVALTALGYEGLHVQHDPALEPPRSIVAYPRGYLRGTEPDGFGFEFDAGEDFAFFEVAGHCILEDR